VTNEEKLILLKKDLQRTTSANDEYLSALLSQASSAIQTEGIILDGTIECDMAVVQYAAYLFRKRAANETSMPRFLRWNLNNILMKQKGRQV
jgi:hypothetical protein